MSPRCPLLVWLLVWAPALACVSEGPQSQPEASATSSESSGSGTSTSEPGPDETGMDTGTDTGGESSESETGEPEPEGNLLLSDKRLNIAHRGGARLRPEATLIAFEHALDVGADIIEFDLHASSDGEIVVIHDSTVDRTTDGTGNVEDMSFAELRELDAGYNFSPDGGESHPYRGMGLQIPTVEEVLESFPERYYLMEIKQVEPSLVPGLLDVLAAFDVEERVVIASFNQVTIDEVRELSPTQFTAMTAQEMIAFNGGGAEPGYAPPCAFIQPPWDFVDAELVELSHQLGLKVHPWTVNNEALMVDLLGYGVDGIMTDDPVLLEAVLADAP